MLVQKEISNIELAKTLLEMEENELLAVLEPFIKKNEPRLLQVGLHRPFRPFKAIEMQGDGPTASEMVIRDRR